MTTQQSTTKDEVYITTEYEVINDTSLGRPYRGHPHHQNCAPFYAWLYGWCGF